MTALKLTAAAIALAAFGGVAMAADSAGKADPNAMDNQTEQSKTKPGDPAGHNSSNTASPASDSATGASSGSSGSSSSSAGASDQGASQNQQAAPSGKDSEAGARSSQ